ncbi:hypothetical protein BH09MYX1_BH09MYX1_26380 [soil metagenome]
MRRSAIALLALPLSIGIACGGGAAVAPPVKPPVTHGPAPSRVRWVLQGYDDFHATAYVRTEEGELFFGPHGERVLRTGSQLGAAGELLPETIVSAQLRDGKLRLLGTTGTVYLGTKALGSMTAKLSPFDGARAASASESALFVLDRGGTLHRSRDGQAWTDVNLPGLIGFATDVALSGKRGLVTAVPPQLFATVDEGLTWKIVDGPVTGVSAIVVDRDDVLVRGGGKWSRFEPPNVFSVAAAPGLWSPSWPARGDIVRVLDRGVVAELTKTGETLLAVHPAGAPSVLRPISDIPASCKHLDLALLGAGDKPTVAIRCDGLDRSVTIFESTDGGASFHVEAKLDGGAARTDHAAIAIGPLGALFIGERCKDEWGNECAPAVVRSASGGAFVPVGVGIALAAGFDPASGGFFVVSGEHDRTKLLRTSAAGVEDLGVIVPSESTSATIGLGGDGTSGIVIRSGEDLAAFTATKTGFHPMPVPTIRLKSGAMAGDHGLLLGVSGRAYETVDGTSFHEVLVPASAQRILGCSAAGCLLDRGVRVGWDDATTAIARPITARPGLTCKPVAAPIAVGSFGAPPRSNALDHGPHRLVFPTRDGDGGVRVLRAPWPSDAPDAADHFTTTEALGPAQPYPAFGSRALIVTQAGGVAIARYTWKRIKFEGKFSPLELELAWLRDGESVAHRIKDTIPAFRSGTELVAAAIDAATPPEVLSLESGGLHWHAPIGAGDFAIGRWYDDRGVMRKAAFPDGVHGTGVTVIGDRDATIVFADDEGDLTIADVTEKRALVLLPGVAPDDRALVLSTLGGKGIAIATHRRAARSFAFGIVLRGAPTSVELPTQRSLEGSIAACTAATPGEPIDLPWIAGTRRAVRIVDAGTERLFVTDRARVPISGSAVTCLTGYDATPLDHGGASVLLFGDGARGLLVEMAAASNAGGTVRAIACAPDDGSIPRAYGDVPGMAD